LKTFQNPQPIKASLARHIITAFFFGSIYYNLSSSQVLERTSLAFFTCLFAVMGHQQSIPIVFDERLLFYRERAAKIYGDFSYFITGGVAIFPLNMIYILLYVSALYFLTGFRRDFEHFLFFYIVTAMTSACGLFYCQLLAALCPSQQAAITLFPATLFFFIAFAGYIIFIPSLPEWLECWAPSVSFVRWSFQALVINEFKDNSDVFPPITIGNIVVRSTDEMWMEFAENYGFETHDKWYCVTILAINAAIYRGLNFFALRYVKFEKR